MENFKNCDQSPKTGLLAIRPDQALHIFCIEALVPLVKNGGRNGKSPMGPLAAFSLANQLKPGGGLPLKPASKVDGILEAIGQPPCPLGNQSGWDWK